VHTMPLSLALPLSLPCSRSCTLRNTGTRESHTYHCGYQSLHDVYLAI
jgi:hypothetical protein